MEQKLELRDYKLGYSFAKKHGVIIQKVNTSDDGTKPVSVVVACREYLCSPVIVTELKDLSVCQLVLKFYLKFNLIIFSIKYMVDLLHLKLNQ